MRRVAIVEHDAMMALLLEEVCRTSGYEIVGWESDVHSALAMIEREEPDFLLLEYDLGASGNGLDLLERALRLCPSLISIMITAWDINDIASRIHRTQPDRILRKPVHPDILMKVMAGAQPHWPMRFDTIEHVAH